jgi:hypothetical protein
MTTRAEFLKTRYGGYLHREVPDEDAELSHVGPNTPCGEYLRRFWQPICFSGELKVPVRLLRSEICRSEKRGRQCASRKSAKYLKGLPVHLLARR